ncbi:MAG: amidase [Acidobacteria bacterium]|nr:amidase [Acidobacteriota bacterium]
MQFRAIADIGAELRDGRTTAATLVDDCLAAIAARNDELNAFVLVRDAEARAEARGADEGLADGEDRGPLHGIPIALKDLIDLKGTPTTAASRPLLANVARADAPIVTRLCDADAVIVGKCNLHELAFGTTGEESAFGMTRNPFARDRSAGGSSSGSAVAVATGMAVAAIGTDTGGSIRIPASACGVVGLKPTHGEVSLEGVVPLAPSLDHAGPIARTVEDAATIFRIIRDDDVGDDIPEPPARPRLGIPRRYFFDLVEPAVEAAFDAAVARLESGGVAVRGTDIAGAEETTSVYARTQRSEAFRCHAKLLERHAADISPGVRERLESGRSVADDDYGRAQERRKVLAAAVDAALAGCDALLLPTLPILPPPIGAETVELDGRDEPVRPLMLRLTQLFDVTGHPAISIPCGDAGGVPVGLQLVGRRGETDRLLALAAAWEGVIRE